MEHNAVGTNQAGNCKLPMKPAWRHAAGSGAFLSFLRPKEPFDPGQKVVQVPAELLPTVHAFGRERLRHL